MLPLRGELQSQVNTELQRLHMLIHEYFMSKVGEVESIELLTFIDSTKMTADKLAKFLKRD